MSTCNCPSLFQPGKIGSVEVRNRSFMPSMGLSNTEGGYVNDACIRHYVERAKGGFGMISTEHVCVDYPLGLNTANQLRIDNDSYIPGLKKLVDAVHAEGCKIVAEISHTGRGAKREVIGDRPVGPSAIPMPMMYIIGVERETPRELTIPEIEAIEDKYAAAALRAKKAGFDGVEIHSTGYYLCVQFLNSLSNQRKDKYGGPIENRMLFLENIIRKTRALCGEDFALLVKPSLLNGEGITFQEGMYIVKRLCELGVDGIEVMAGGTQVMPDDNSLPFTASPATPMAPAAKAFRDYAKQLFGENLKTQFIAGGDVRKAEHIQKLFDDDVCDFVFIGKSCVVEPHFVRLLEEGRDGEIHPCIGCYVCASDQLASGAHCYCSGNGALSVGSRYDLPPADKVKKVLVVGGGPAGIEAAKILKKRGPDVTIMEKSDSLGGQIRYAEKPLMKDHFKALIPYFYETVRANDIPVLYNTEATVESVREFDPDAVIIAAGVKPHPLPVPGIDLPNVISGKDYLIGDRAVEGKRVVVVGGGDVGCEVAEKLGSEGHEVTLVEMTDMLAPGYMFGNRCVLLHGLHRWGVTIHLGQRCHEICEDKVVVADKYGFGFRFDIPCDNVVMCTGDAPNNDLAEALRGLVPEVYNIGDSAEVSNLAKAHAAAYALARTL